MTILSAVARTFSRISRADFVKRFVEAGFDYEEAHRAYCTMTRVFEEAILSNAKLSVGRVGSLVPTVRPPRVIKMGFVRNRQGCKKCNREFSYDETIRWKFKVHRKFAQRFGVDGRLV